MPRKRVVDDELRSVRLRLGRDTSAAHGARCEGARDMVMAVMRVALDGDEEIAGCERARVDGDARRGLRQRRAWRRRARP